MMFRSFFRRLFSPQCFSRPRQPQVYLFRCDGSPWTKIVIVRPLSWPWNFTIGPFRSEADAEQAADHLNANLNCGVLYYNPENAPVDEPIDTEFEEGSDDEGEEWKKAGN